MIKVIKVCNVVHSNTHTTITASPTTAANTTLPPTPNRATATTSSTITTSPTPGGEQGEGRGYRQGAQH